MLVRIAQAFWAACGCSVYANSAVPGAVRFADNAARQDCQLRLPDRSLMNHRGIDSLVNFLQAALLCHRGGRAIFPPEQA